MDGNKPFLFATSSYQLRMLPFIRFSLALDCMLLEVLLEVGEQ